MANIATSGHLLLPVTPNKFNIAFFSCYIPNFHPSTPIFSALQIFANFWTSIHLEKKIHSPDCSTKSPLCLIATDQDHCDQVPVILCLNVKFPKGTSAFD